MRRLGLVGPGNHGMYHLTDALRTGHFILTAVVDKNVNSEGVAAVVAKFPHVKVFATVEQMIASGLVDVAIITSPDKYHPKQLHALVKGGIHTLVDKPLAVNRRGWRIAKRALALAAKKKVVVTSCHPRRFDPPYLWTKQNLSRLIGLYGQLTEMHLRFWYHIPGADWKHNRSLLLDHLPHEIDFAWFVFGTDTFVTLTSHFDGFDRYAATGRAGNTLLNFSGTRRLTREKAFPEVIQLVFDQGECTVNTETGVAVRYSYQTGETVTEHPGRTAHDQRNYGVMQDFLAMLNGKPGQLTHAAILGNTKAAIDLVEGRIYKSR